MTLIAGFRAFGVPILIGDFLLTRAGRPAGLSKKLRRLRPNCVVAWTGPQVAAESVIRYLDQRLPAEGTSRQELDECFREYEISELGDLPVLHVIGWVVDQEQHCFRWNSGYPGEVFYGESMFDGSGDATIAQLTELRIISDPDNPSLVSVERAIDASLDITASLVSGEIFGRHNRALGFGHAYEVLYFDGHHFKYVSDVLYVLLSCVASDGGSLSPPELCKPVYKYQSFDELSVVNALNEKNDREIFLITAVGENQSLPAARAFERQFYQTPKPDRHFGFESQYYCIFIRVTEGPHVGHLLTAVQGPRWPADQCFLSASKNEFRVRVSLDMLNDLYRTLREHRR